MNIIKFFDKHGKLMRVKITEKKAGIYGLQHSKSQGLSRRAAFILARRKGWTHPKMCSDK